MSLLCSQINLIMFSKYLLFLLCSRYSDEGYRFRNKTHSLFPEKKFKFYGQNNTYVISVTYEKCYMLEVFLNNTCRTSVLLSKPLLGDTSFGKPFLNPQLGRAN